MTSSDSSSAKEAPSASPLPYSQVPEKPHQVSISSRRTHLSWSGLLPTAFVIAVTAGLGTLILVWLRYHQYGDGVNFKTGFSHALHDGYFTVYEGSKMDDAKTGSKQDVATMRVLTFSSLASHLMGMTSSFLMSLVAYRYASHWLNLSHSGGAEHDFPTPLQYGLLLRIFGSSSITGLFKATRYAALKRTDRPRLPKLFLEPLIIACIVFFLTHLYGGADFWLHNRSQSTFTYAYLPPFEDDLGDASVAFDGVLSGCDDWTASAWPCLNTATGWAQDAYAQDKYVKDGIAAAYNSTYQILSVITLNNFDDAAILIGLSGDETYIFTPAFDNSAKTFTASTTGAKAACEIITNQCTNTTSGLTTTCQGAGYPQLPVIGAPSLTSQGGPQPPFEPYSTSLLNTSNDLFTIPSRVLGLVDGRLAGTNLGVSDLPTTAAVTNNPATLLIQLRWASLFDGVALQPTTEGIEPPTFDTYPAGYHTLYATCQLEYFTGQVTFDPLAAGYALDSNSFTPVSPEMASILWSPLLAQYGTDALTSIIQNIAMSDNAESVQARLNQEVARMAIALPAGLFTAGPATDVRQVYKLILGQYPVGAVFLAVAILYLYSITAIFIFISSHAVSSYSVLVPATSPPTAPTDEKTEFTSTTPTVHEERPALQLGQMWLTDPLPLIAAMFPEGDGENGKRSAAGDSLGMVSDHSAATRLQIGVHEKGGETVFGLRSRSTANVGV